MSIAFEVKRLRGLLVAVVFGSVLAVPSIASAQAVEYYHTDALGTPIVVTDASGNVVERSEYEPYGKVLNRAKADEPGYTGHVEDAATGLTYMQQRYYDPEIGRFVSVDPIATSGASGQSFNRYWYANGNPYRFTDPDGRTAASPSCNTCEDKNQKEARERKGSASGSMTNHHRGAGAFLQGASSLGSFTTASFGERAAAATRVVAAGKDALEAKGHKTEDQAAIAFHRFAQPISSRYGVEVGSTIDPNFGSGFHLSGTFVGTDYRSDGYGAEVIMASQGLPTLHTHPIGPGGDANWFRPFSSYDVNWYGTDKSVQHYVSTPDGIYRYDAGQPVKALGD